MKATFLILLGIGVSIYGYTKWKEADDIATIERGRAQIAQMAQEMRADNARLNASLDVTLEQLKRRQSEIQAQREALITEQLREQPVPEAPEFAVAQPVQQAAPARVQEPGQHPDLARYFNRQPDSIQDQLDDIQRQLQNAASERQRERFWAK